MASWDPLFEKKLLSAENYRQFVGSFFENKDPHARPRALSYQAFANRAGFSSKSFIADVIAGRKRITLTSFDKVILGLGLNKAWSDYFKTLVAIAEEDFIIGKKSQEHYLNRLKELKYKLQNKKKTIQSRGISPSIDIILGPYFPEVFASLGSIGEGATLKEIEKRTRLPSHELRKIMIELEKAQLIEYIAVTDKYRPFMDALEIDELSSDQSFEKDFFRSIEKTKKRFKQQAHSKKSLFMNQTFSVNENRLDALRAELKKLIDEFSDNAEAFDGDAVAEICIGFTNNADLN